jgi:transcriptional regulator GlxA family with amidase domain
MSQTRNVAILIFDDVEVLDFTGPLEAFSVAGREADSKPFHVYTVAETLTPVQTRNGLSVNPTHTLADCPRPDILLVPGGYGTRREMNNPVIIEWIKTLFPDLELLLSVCTGSLILAKAGLLDGLNSTTHFGAYDLLKELAPATTVCPGARFLDNGKIIVSAGVSAGIDMSFHVIARLLGDDVAQEAAHYIEYEYWQPG